MLTKKARLSRDAFQTAFKRARRVLGVGFVLLVTPSPTFHASVVVSKKVAPRAVDRNRLRRTLYGVLAQLVRELREQGLSSQVTVIVIVQPVKGAGNAPRHVSSADMTASLRTLCKDLLSR